MGKTTHGMTERKKREFRCEQNTKIKEEKR